MQFRINILIALLLLTILLSACGGRVLGTSWPNMSLGDDTLYIANNAAVYALNPATGALQWQFPVTGDRDTSQFYAEPTHTDDLVVVSSYNQLAYALDANGDLRWPRPFDAEPLRTSTAPSATSADGNFVYLVAGNTLHALNPENGQEVWQFNADNALWAAPATDGERLYQPSMNHVLYALDPETGSERWQEDFAGALASTPTVVDGTVYLGSLSNHAYAVDAATGNIRWTLKTEGWVWSSPVVVAGVAYLGDLGGTVYAAEADTGNRVWTVPLDSAVRGAPAVSDEAVFVNTEGGFVYALDTATGVARWQVEIDPQTGERLLATPVLTDDLVLISALNGTDLVYAYNQETGTPAWQFDPDR